MVDHLVYAVCSFTPMADVVPAPPPPSPPPPTYLVARRGHADPVLVRVNQRRVRRRRGRARGVELVRGKEVVTTKLTRPHGW